MTWFEKLTGIDEQSPLQVRRELSVEGDQIVCPNGKRFAFGRLETPKLSDLRQAVADLNVAPRRSTICEIVGDVRALNADPANADALFQVASQFNLLEMTGPSVTPERGVGIYESDPTQGPACAIACGAGTIYRNYFAPVGDSIGQSADIQIDCSSDLGISLGNAGGRLWSMQNGYLFPTNDGLNEISTKLQQSTEDELDDLRGDLRIGLQWRIASRGKKERISVHTYLKFTRSRRGASKTIFDTWPCDALDLRSGCEERAMLVSQPRCAVNPSHCDSFRYSSAMNAVGLEAPTAISRLKTV